MIESGQISEKDPVQNQLQNVHKATTKNTRYEHTHQIEENYSKLRANALKRNRLSHCRPRIKILKRNRLSHCRQRIKILKRSRSSHCRQRIKILKRSRSSHCQQRITTKIEGFHKITEIDTRGRTPPS